MRFLNRKWQTMRGLLPSERRLAFRALGTVAVIRLALWVLPFRRIRQTLEARSPRENGPDTLQPTAAQIAWAVKLASRYVPRATCLTQALAAEILLQRAGIESAVHIGVSLDDGTGESRKSFGAHAWVEQQGSVLLGGAEVSARYTRILTLKNVIRPRVNADENGS
jgi:hypothetical protein